MAIKNLYSWVLSQIFLHANFAHYILYYYYMYTVKGRPPFGYTRWWVLVIFNILVVTLTRNRLDRPPPMLWSFNRGLRYLSDITICNLFFYFFFCSQTTNIIKSTTADVGNRYISPARSSAVAKLSALDDLYHLVQI